MWSPPITKELPSQAQANSSSSSFLWVSIPCAPLSHHGQYLTPKDVHCPSPIHCCSAEPQEVTRTSNLGSSRAHTIVHHKQSDLFNSDGAFPGPETFPVAHERRKEAPSRNSMIWGLIVCGWETSAKTDSQSLKKIFEGMSKSRWASWQDLRKLLLETGKP